MFEARVGDVEAVARQCIFTTHTPVPAGHDRFSADLVRAVLGDRAALLDALQLWEGAELNMTRLALPLLERQLAGRTAFDLTPADVAAVARQCVFTTHTPVPAGHDRFSAALAREVLANRFAIAVERGRPVAVPVRPPGAP